MIDKAYLTTDAILGLGFNVRRMRDTPLDQLDVAAALKFIEDECARIARGEVSEADLMM